MKKLQNIPGRIKIFIIIILLGIFLSKCEIPKPSYSLIGPGILYTPL